MEMPVAWQTVCRHDDFVKGYLLDYWTQSLPAADVFNGGCITSLVKKKKKARPDAWKEGN